MINPAHKLPISKQAKALGISRSCVYYVPKPVPDVDLAIMRRRTNAAHSLGDR